MFVLPSVYRIVFSRSYQQKVRSFFRVTVCAVLASALSSPLYAANTVVRMVTDFGNIDIELYDDQAPKTVANFLRYAGRGDYNNSIIHRSIPGFAIQGGGYSYFFPFPGSQYSLNVEIPSDPPVQNEFSPSRSNVRGTIAMAKLPGNPDSATSEWFFNLADNNAPYDPNKSDSEQSLDYQNGGFTVFGNVIDNVLDPGMSVVNAIATVPTYPPRATCNPPPPPIVSCAYVVLPIFLPQSKNIPFLDFPLINYNYDPVTPPTPQPSNFVSVIGIPNVRSTGTIWGTLATFTADPEITLSGVGTYNVTATEAKLSEFTPPPKNPVKYIAGILYFKATGVMGAGRAITLRHGSTEVPNRYYAYGKTSDNPTDHWYDFTYDPITGTGAEFAGDKILLHFVDGQRGDDDDLNSTNDSITHTGTAVLSTEFVPIDNSSGCTIAATSSPATSHGDWIIVSMFLVFIGLVRRRVRH